MSDTVTLVSMLMYPYVARAMNKIISESMQIGYNVKDKPPYLDFLLILDINMTDSGLRMKVY